MHQCHYKLLSSQKKPKHIPKKLVKSYRIPTLLCEPSAHHIRWCTNQRPVSWEIKLQIGDWSIDQPSKCILFSFSPPRHAPMASAHRRGSSDKLVGSLLSSRTTGICGGKVNIARISLQVRYNAGTRTHARTQIDGWMDRWVSKYADRQTDRQTDRYLYLF